MPPAWKEREDLAKVDIRIAEAERCVAQQTTLIEWMTKKGRDTEEAEKLLRTLEWTLALYRIHRQLILDEIARREGPEP